MRKISDFLERFKKFKNPDDKKELLIKIILSETGQTLQKNQIDVSNKSVFLKTSSAIKNGVFLKKNLILKKISEQGDFLINDIH